MNAQAFVHLHTHSAFSFGDGAPPVESLVLRAAQYGMPTLALTDTMSLSGIPSLVRRCAKAGIAPIGGCEIILEGGDRLTLLADGPAGFASLSRLLSAAQSRDVKRQGARLRWEELETHAENLVCLTGADSDGLLPRLIRGGQYEAAHRGVDRLLDIFGRDNVFIEVTRTLTEVAFKDMMRRRASEEFEDWLESAKGSGLVGFSSFVRGIRADYAAVKAAFSLEWSNAITLA